MPPASTKPSGDPKCCATHSPALQLAIHRSASLPLLEHEHSQSTVQPLIHVGKDVRRVRETEIRLPSHQVAAQQRHHLREAASAGSRRDLSHALLHFLESLRRHATFDDLSWGIPETVPEK